MGEPLTIGSSKRNPPKTRVQTHSYLSRVRTLCERTEPPWREAAGLTFTDLPFIDCTHLRPLVGQSSIVRDLLEAVARRLVSSFVTASFLLLHLPLPPSAVLDTTFQPCLPALFGDGVMSLNNPASQVGETEQLADAMFTSGKMNA